MANQQLPIDQQEEDDSTFFDLLAAPFRGIEGAVQGVYNLADYLTFDALPDYDTKFLGKSKTVAGGAVEGITQFVTGFVPIFGWAGRAGNLAKAGSLTQKALSGTVSRGAIAGAVTDFTMFNGQEARLSNLIESVPELQNPVTQFLSHDDEEGEIEGRLKNVLEGLGLEAVAFGFIKGLKAMKKGRQARAENADPDSVYSAMDLEMGDLASVRPSSPEMLDEFDNEIIDEWYKHLDMEADHDEVISALGKFKPKYRSFLKALAKEDWLGFDYPAQAVDQFIRNPNVYDEFEVSPALKAAATKLQNAGFRGDLASVKGIVAYHGGTAGKTFEAQAGGDLGFHFGSKEAAQERISRVGGKGEVQEYVLDINNPLRLNDPISFRGRGEGGRKFKQELKDAGIDVDVSKDYSREELTQLIKDKGYDGIVYKNAAEGVKEGKLSDSYVALDASQIKQSEGLGQETFLRRSGIFANRIDDSTMRLIREGFRTDSNKDMTWETVSPEGKPAPTVDNVLKSLSKNAKYPEVKELAKNLRKIIKDVNDKNVIVTASDTYADPSTIRGGAKGEIAGMYSPTKDRVVLFPSADEQTLVHELLHGVTSRKLNAWVKHGGKDRSLTLKNIDNVIKNRKAPKPIRELASSFKEAMQEFKRLEKSGFAPTPEGKTLYAFKDLDEFLVAAFTDYDLQKILRRMPSKDNRTIFQKIVDAVKDMLGYSHRADGSLLDKVLRDSAQIISMKRPQRAGGETMGMVKRDVWRTPEQEVSSAATSINKGKLPAAYGKLRKIGAFLKGMKVVDIGGGRFDNAVESLKKEGVDLKVYDPFNRSSAHNQKVADAVRGGQADAAVNNNVLNVIKERENQLLVVEQAHDAVKAEGKAYFSVYEGNKSGTGKATKQGFQHNKKVSEYVELIEEVFGKGNVEVKNGIITATKKTDDAMASVRGDLGDIDPKHKEFAEAVVKGAEVVPPRMETTDGIHSLTAALRAEVTKDPATMAKLDQEAAEGLPTDFGDNVITDRFKGMEDTIENQRQVRLEATVYKRVGEGLVRNLMTAGDKYRQSGGGTVAVAELKNTLQELVEFSNYYWRLGRESSLALGVRRNKEPSRKIGLNEADMTSEGIRKNFINENGGMDPEKIMKIIDETVDPNDLQGSLNGIMGLARKTQGSRLLDMPREYWINSILSGPRTQVVNVMGNALAGVWSTLETAVGGVMTGNLEVTKQAFASWADMTMYKEAFKFARNTLKTAENTLDPDARAFGEGPQNAITAEAFGVKEGQRGRDSINGLGDFIRIPSRLLMTTDEFFKQLHYRRSARLKLAMDGLGQGIQDPYKLAEHIEKGLESIVTDSGRYMSEESLIREGTEIADGQGLKGQEKADFIINYKNEKFNEDASGLANYAVDEARYMTFTKELEEGTLARGIQNLSQKHNLVGFILPFVRTPTNLLKFAFERTPGVLMLPAEVKKLLKDLKSDDPILKAQANGKIATSGIASAVMLDMALNNREFLTGGGPKDHKQKKALQATGWQPYSFKIDGKYYSYQRLDPFGTLLGVMADLVETGIKSPKGFNDSAIDQVFSAVAVTFTRNVTNKSYLAGLQMFTEAASNPERYGDRLLRNFGSSMLPYSGFLSQIQYGTGDQESREVRTLADALLNKIPSGRDNLDPKRNLLGEEIMVENLPLIGAINPIATSTEKNDVILNEMASLNHAFREPPSTYHNLIDLLAFENDSGQTAHDRRLEKLKTQRIGGRTLRQSLERLIRSRAYQKLSATSEPGFPSPRIQKINSILTKYRSEALDDTMREFPELSGYYDQVTRAKKQFRMGADFTDVLSLLQQ